MPGRIMTPLHSPAEHLRVQTRKTSPKNSDGEEIPIDSIVSHKTEGDIFRVRWEGWRPGEGLGKAAWKEADLQRDAPVL